MHASVQHHSRPYIQGYATFTDKWGQSQTLLAVAEQRCMVRTRPPVVKLRSATETVIAKGGSIALCPLILERTSLFAGAMQVELINPPPGVVLVDGKVSIAAGKDTASVRVRLEKEKSGPAPILKFRATGKLAGGVTVVSEASVAIAWR